MTMEEIRAGKYDIKCVNCLHTNVCKHKEMYIKAIEELDEKLSSVPACFCVYADCIEFKPKDSVQFIK